MSNTDGHRGAITVRHLQRSHPRSFLPVCVPFACDGFPYHVTEQDGLGCLVDQYRARIWPQLNEPLPYTIFARLHPPSELSSCSTPKSRYLYGPWKELPALSYLRSSAVFSEKGLSTSTSRVATSKQTLWATVGINDQMGHS